MRLHLHSLVRAWALALLTPLPLVGGLRLPRYLRAWRRYARLAAGCGEPAPGLADSYPCLNDWTTHTPFDPHYFYQGAWLARRVAAQKPALHVDVGSSALTLSVLSAQVNTVQLDYRPLRAALSGLQCAAADLKRLPLADASQRSLSCLHVIEHVGLGRYGDPLEPMGSRRAARELARVIAPGGRLYVSVPVGRARVCFNAHRVFAPESFAALFAPLVLQRFSLVDDAGGFHEDARPADAARLEYGCGLYEFVRAAQAELAPGAQRNGSGGGLP